MANDQIKKADNGTYYFRANLGFDHSTGKRIQKYRSGFKTKKEAKEEYAKLVLQFASQSLPTEQKRIPFGTFIEDTYLPWYQTQVKESTFENRAGTVRKHFSCFYEKFTDAIEPIDIQNWQLALIRAGYSPNYVRVTQGMLSVAFDRAVILGITERNPSRMVGNVRGQKPLVDFCPCRTCWSAGDQARLGAAKSHRGYPPARESSCRALRPLLESLVQ